MFGILDIVIVILVLMGIVFGAKKGVIKSIVDLVGLILVLILSYFLKNPVADLLFNIFPFIDYKDFTAGGTILNILFFETIAFIIVFVVLLFVLRMVMRATKLIEKILNATIILGLISKILGAIVGFIEYYVIAFIVVYILTLPIFGLDLTGGKLANAVLNKSPILSNVMKESLASIVSLQDLINVNKNNTKSNEYNIMAIDHMLKGGIITVKTADKLVADGKLKYNGVEAVINKYRE